MQNITRHALFFLVTATLTAFANPAFDAYNATPVFGESREVIKDRGNFIYRFNFRGGTVEYQSDRGAQWHPAADRRGGTTYLAGPAPGLPNGCLVYACARAEQIRMHPSKGESKSQVIGYTRSDGGGHAFVLYEQGGKTMAEDDSGALITMPHPLGRSAAEALCMAGLIQGRKHSYSSRPIRASFVGRY